MGKNRIVSANFTIVGGPHHGMKIPESNGFKPVSLTSASCHHKPLEYVPMRFMVGDNKSVVTVFSPPDIFEKFVTDFLNGKYEDYHMRDYDILQDKVYPPKKAELKRIGLDELAYVDDMSSVTMTEEQEKRIAEIVDSSNPTLLGDDSSR